MREADVLSDDVKTLVRRYVPSPLHLEALVTVARDPARLWAPAEIIGAKYPDAGAMARALRDLAASDLVEVAGTADAPRYRIAPSNPILLRSLERLVHAYERMPVQLVRAVYERPPDSVQSFADAFRFQKPQ